LGQVVSGLPAQAQRYASSFIIVGYESSNLGTNSKRFNHCADARSCRVWSYILYLDSFYYQNAPREPIPVEERIHPKVVHHGAHVFLTEREVFNFDVLFPSISIGSVLIAGLLAMRWKQFGFKKDFKSVDFFYFFRKNKRT
jgi:hypothetical protein